VQARTELYVEGVLNRGRVPLRKLPTAWVGTPAKYEIPAVADRYLSIERCHEYDIRTNIASGSFYDCSMRLQVQCKAAQRNTGFEENDPVFAFPAEFAALHLGEIYEFFVVGVEVRGGVGYYTPQYLTKRSNGELRIGPAFAPVSTSGLTSMSLQIQVRWSSRSHAALLDLSTEDLMATD
jgi:hypothetical protein